MGFFCFRDKLESILLSALWIGISWLFRGFTLLAAALSFDHLPARGWQVLSGVIIVIGRGVLIISPLDSIAILTLVAGWWLIVIGIVDGHQRVPGSPSAEGLDTQLTDDRVAQGNRCSTSKARQSSARSLGAESDRPVNSSMRRRRCRTVLG